MKVIFQKPFFLQQDNCKIAKSALDEIAEEALNLLFLLLVAQWGYIGRNINVTSFLGKATDLPKLRIKDQENEGICEGTF